MPGIVRRLTITLLHSPREEAEDTDDLSGSWLGPSPAIPSVLSVTQALLSLVHTVSEMPMEKCQTWISFPVSKYCWKSENGLENKTDYLSTNSGLYVYEEKEVIVFFT